MRKMPRRGPNGNIYGFQLWVNLPAAQKMSQPRYQEVSAGSIPVVEREGARIRVVAGNVDGVPGPVTEIAADPVYMDVELEPDASFELAIPEGHTAVAYVFEGQGMFGLDLSGLGELVEAVRLVVFDDGDHLQVQTGRDSRVRFMLMAGEPFKEPTVPYGPFVMNTWEEIQQTLDDLRSGVFAQG